MGTNGPAARDEELTGPEFVEPWGIKWLPNLEARFPDLLDLDFFKGRLRHSQADFEKPDNPWFQIIEYTYSKKEKGLLYSAVAWLL